MGKMCQMSLIGVLLRLPLASTKKWAWVGEIRHLGSFDYTFLPGYDPWHTSWSPKLASRDPWTQNQEHSQMWSNHDSPTHQKIPWLYMEYFWLYNDRNICLYIIFTYIHICIYVTIILCIYRLYWYLLGMLKDFNRNFYYLCLLSGSYFPLTSSLMFDLCPLFFTEKRMSHGCGFVLHFIFLVLRICVHNHNGWSQGGRYLCWAL